MIFYTTSAKWEERFYHGVVDSVKSPAFDDWDGERLLQNNLTVNFHGGYSEACL